LLTAKAPKNAKPAGSRPLAFFGASAATQSLSRATGFHKSEKRRFSNRVTLRLRLDRKWGVCNCAPPKIANIAGESRWQRLRVSR
jgi:hypothetical protein